MYFASFIVHIKALIEWRFLTLILICSPSWTSLQHYDMAKCSELEAKIQRKSIRLHRLGISNSIAVKHALQNLNVPTFDDLTSIDRLWQDKVSIGLLSDNVEKQAEKMLDLLKESREDFLKVRVIHNNVIIKKSEWLHPMDIIYHFMRSSDLEAKRILVENLDKMKFALPLVIPNFQRKPLLSLWPFLSISRQAGNSNFQASSSSRHVVACVGLNQSNVFTNASLSTHSKSEYLNKIFFEGQQRFITGPLKHGDKIQIMKRSQEGSIDSAIFTAGIQNNGDKDLNQFKEIWNLHGNIDNGLTSQINLIRKYASCIIVMVEDNTNLIDMERKIIKAFGENQQIIVLILDDKINQQSSSSLERLSDDSDEEDGKMINSTKFRILTLKDDKEESFQQIRHFVNEKTKAPSDFVLESLCDDPLILKEFNVDMAEPIVTKSTKLAKEIVVHVKSLKKENVKFEAFPLYFSRSPLDKSKTIVENIDFLKDKKVKFFHKSQRADYEHDKKIEDDIAFLRDKQNQLINRSKLCRLYMNHIQKLALEFGKEGQESIAASIRVYHKILAQQFQMLSLEGLDIVGLQRELGQLYISVSNSKNTKSEFEDLIRVKTLQSDIIKCLYETSSAGVSLEFVDGDTQNVNKDIIIHLLKKFE